MDAIQRWNPASRTALRGALLIAGLYLLAGFIWIVVADSLIGRLGGTPAVVLKLQYLKSWGFLLVTAVALCALIERSLRLAVRSGEIDQLVNYDALTGLPNSALLCSQVGRALVADPDRRQGLTVFAVHVDGLRQVNEQCGPLAGDAVITTIAERLRGALPPGAILARHEGSAFVAVVALSQPGPDEAEKVRLALLQATGEAHLVGGTEVHLQGSIGISRFPGDGDTAREVIAAATTAMNRARQKGGPDVRRFTARITRGAFERFRIEHELRRAISDGTFDLVYQPQVRLADSAATGMEALLRWTHPELGPIPPSRFIPIAEESGLIQPMGEWALRQACNQAAIWRREGIADLRVAVNLSPRQLGHRGLLRYVEQVLRESGLPADRLELEVTEYALASQPDLALRILRDLKDVGVSIAIDDFGAGYSSLSYLQVLPIDRLKIDRSFVSSVDRDLRAEAICRTVLDMGRNLLMIPLAEGIENEGQRRTLLRLGCEEGQGFLFARPMQALDVPGWLGVEPVRGETRPLSALAL